MTGLFLFWNALAMWSNKAGELAVNLIALAHCYTITSRKFCLIKTSNNVHNIDHYQLNYSYYSEVFMTNIPTNGDITYLSFPVNIIFREF